MSKQATSYRFDEATNERLDRLVARLSSNRTAVIATALGILEDVIDKGVSSIPPSAVQPVSAEEAIPLGAVQDDPTEDALPDVITYDEAVQALEQGDYKYGMMHALMEGSTRVFDITPSPKPARRAPSFAEQMEAARAAGTKPR